MKKNVHKTMVRVKIEYLLKSKQNRNELTA